MRDPDLEEVGVSVGRAHREDVLSLRVLWYTLGYAPVNVYHVPRHCLLRQRRLPCIHVMGRCSGNIYENTRITKQR